MRAVFFCEELESSFIFISATEHLDKHVHMVLGRGLGALVRQEFMQHCFIPLFAFDNKGCGLCYSEKKH